MASEFYEHLLHTASPNINKCLISVYNQSFIKLFWHQIQSIWLSTENMLRFCWLLTEEFLRDSLRLTSLAFLHLTYCLVGMSVKQSCLLCPRVGFGSFVLIKFRIYFLL